MRALAYLGTGLLCTVLLTACQTQATQPGASGPEGSSAASMDVDQQTAPGQLLSGQAAAQSEGKDTQQQPANRQASAPAGPEQLLESSRQVEQRITLMQEQVIRLNEQMTAAA